MAKAFKGETVPLNELDIENFEFIVKLTNNV